MHSVLSLVPIQFHTFHYIEDHIISHYYQLFNNIRHIFYQHHYPVDLKNNETIISKLIGIDYMSIFEVLK